MIDIFRIQPFCTDPNQFGRVLNDHCAASPYEWIQLMDQDAMLLDHIEANKVMEQAIIKYPDTDIFGAYTNRCGYLWQMTDDWEESNHEMLDTDRIEFLNVLAARTRIMNGPSCKHIPSVAGFFMLFKKSYWEKNRFQDKVIEGKKTFDKMFCSNANIMRLIKGVYVYHRYRQGKDISDDSHLRQGSLF